MKVHLTRGDIAGFVFANTTFWGSGNYRYVSVITPFFFFTPAIYHTTPILSLFLLVLCVREFLSLFASVYAPSIFTFA